MPTDTTQLPGAPDLSELATFVEADTELPKATLLHRAAGHISESLFRYLQSSVFLRAIKDHAGRIFLV